MSVPDERYDVQSRGIIRISKELHQSMYNASSDLRELDSGDMNGLNQKLPVFRCLDIQINIKIRVQPVERERTFSKSASCVFNSCFFKNSTTSSTFRLEVMLRTMLMAFRRTSMSALKTEGTKDLEPQSTSDAEPTSIESAKCP